MFTKSQNWKSRLRKKILTLLCAPMFFGLIFSAPILAHASEPTNLAINNDDNLNLTPITLSGRALDGKVRLSWVDQNPLEDLSGYQIIYSNHPQISFDPPKYTAMIRVGTLQAFEIEGLENGTEYYFAVARVSLQEDFLAQSDVLKLVPIDNETPTTSLTTNPSLPSGQNHWFISNPEITLATSEKATTYYQWNSLASSMWQVYSQALIAPEGENILYYYSVDSANNIEATKWQIVKVDTIAPLAPVLEGKWDESSASIQLSWNQNPDVSKIDVWQTLPTESLIATIPASQSQYSLSPVAREQSYGFKLLAYDVAGNVISSNEVSFQVPAKPIVVAAVVAQNQPVVSVPVTSKVEPQIGEGVSTVSSAITEDASQKDIAGTQDQSPQNENQNGWNRLLIALSILIIAAGVAVGGYYGYEWMNAKSGKDDGRKDSRW